MGIQSTSDRILLKKEEPRNLSPLPSPVSKKPTFTESDADVTIEF